MKQGFVRKLVENSRKWDRLGLFHLTNVNRKGFYREASSYLLENIRNVNKIGGRLNKVERYIGTDIRKEVAYDDNAANETESNMLKVLRMFPEYEAGINFEQKSSFTGAAERFREIFNILNALHPQQGAELDALMFVAFRQALILSEQCEDYMGAINVLQSQVDPYISHADENHLSKQKLSYAIRKYQLESACFLKHGDISKAALSASKSLALCESDIYGGSDTMGSSHADIAVFAISYSHMGISSLMDPSEDLSLTLESSEQFLQQSVRWAQGPLHHLQAMTNLGSFHWVKYQLERQDKAAGDHPSLIEAIAYWEEAMQDAVKDANSVTNSAAAMCGPGSEPINIGTETATNESDLKSQSLEDNLKNEEYQVAYANLLCNLAQAYSEMGTQSSKQRRSDVLSSALKTVESNKTKSGQKALARALTQVSEAYIASEQAVSAEGLLRSATTYLSTVKDCRFVYQRAQTMRAYGSLLCQWEKRETEGERLLGDADKLLLTLPCRHIGNKTVHLTPFFEVML
mmetsp:Transcript_32829/g.47397  ORF Transcript_32829/g.47397 Transcript_32829/m.47397 type:complete len:519 (+) Transcript_32829:696-2252(+)